MEQQGLNGITYLACPYSHASKQVREDRFAAVNLAAGHLMRRGRFVFSPISHTHPIAMACELPFGFDYWEAYDKAILDHCCDVVVLTLDGWEDSVGVQAEIAYAKELGLPTTMMAMSDIRNRYD